MATNRYPGTCTRCAQSVAAGDGTIAKSSSGRWTVTHSSCQTTARRVAPAAPAALYASGPARPTGSANKRAGACYSCGGWVEAGAGRLYKCCPDGDCTEHFDSDDGGWHAKHTTQAECNAARVLAKAAAAKAAEERAAKAAATKAAEVIATML